MTKKLPQETQSMANKENKPKENVIIDLCYSSSDNEVEVESSSNSILHAGKNQNRKLYKHRNLNSLF